MLQVQIICKQLCSAELLLGHTGLGDRNTEHLPGGTLSSREEKHKQGRKVKKKGQLLSNLFFCIFAQEFGEDQP